MNSLSIFPFSLFSHFVHYEKHATIHVRTENVYRYENGKKYSLKVEDVDETREIWANF